MYKRLGIAMLGIATAITIGACSPPHEKPSDEPSGAQQQPTALSNAPDPVTLGEDDTADESSEESSNEATCEAEDVDAAGSYGSEPTVRIPQDCSAPETLQKRDLTEGDGAEATSGSDMEVRYQLVTWSNGEVVDGNFDSGGAMEVEDLGDADVIEGWNEGLVGMNQGTRRVLIVPPEEGYGSEGNGPVGADETLVFVVDAVSVQ